MSSSSSSSPSPSPSLDPTTLAPHTNASTIDPTSPPPLNVTELENAFSSPKTRPRQYQLEMLEESLKRNIIVAVSFYRFGGEGLGHEADTL